MTNSIDLKVNDVALALVSEEDAEFIVSLRVDPSLGRFLSATKGDVESQRQWIKTYKTRELDKNEYYFVIKHRDQRVGTVRLYDFKDASFCWGSWIIRRGEDPKVAMASVMMVYDFAFNSLGFLRSHFEVRRDNLSVKKFHLRMGALLKSSDELNDYFEITKEAYAQYRPRLLKMTGMLPDDAG